MFSSWVAPLLVVGGPTDLIFPHYAGAAVPQGLLPKPTVEGILPWFGTPRFIPVPAGPGNNQFNRFITLERDYES